MISFGNDAHLIGLGRHLLANGYDFVTVTPTTHKRVLARGGQGETLRDIFGWNTAFPPSAHLFRIMRYLEDAGQLLREGDAYRSAVRASTVGGQLFLHSSSPTSDENAVFFGPDSYRFVRLIEHSLKGIDGSQIKEVADIGCGSGVGGIAIHRIIGDTAEITLSDINDRAVRFARVNSEINGLTNVSVIQADLLCGLPPLDLIVCNPPYLVDHSRRLYRHGGGELGFDLSVRVATESIQQLKAGGRLILYTGSPIIEGRDLLREALRPLLASASLSSAYFEIDPDVFGEELEQAPYHCADRIAVVALTLIKR